MYDDAMRAAMELHQATHEPRYLNIAFEIAEQSKAMLLMEAVLDNRVLENDSLTAPLVTRRQRIQLQIVQLKEAIGSATAGKDLASLQQALFDSENELDTVINRIQESNPRYSELVNAFDVVTVADLQPILRRDDRALVEYFNGDSMIYTLVVTPDTFAIKSFPKDSAFDTALQFVTKSLHQGDQYDVPNEPDQYVAACSVILDAIWRPVAPLLRKRVTVIPDGPLSFISFEALADSAQIYGKLKFRDLHYLVDQYTISYSYSGTFISKQVLASPGREVSVLAMAPGFGDNPKVRALPESVEGVRQRASEYPTVTAIVNDAATKAAFLQNAPHFDIIDLATHGKFDPKNFLQTRIYFSPDGSNDSLLSPGELYLLNLPARLAILEACETGLGDYRQGEGVMSMARAFMYAGCKSVLMSLWEVPEAASTQRIMQDFYSNLADSLPTDEAIAAAKREFLHFAREEGGSMLLQTHPFYWSELVLIGDHSPIPLPRRQAAGNWIWWSGATALLILIGLGLRSLKKRMSHQD